MVLADADNHLFDGYRFLQNNGFVGTIPTQLGLLAMTRMCAYYSLGVSWTRECLLKIIGLNYITT